MTQNSQWIAFIRHGVTEWNKAGRIQGHTDIPLSPEGREAVKSWSIPPQLTPDRWVSSPLGRAVETANLLGSDALEKEPLLTEMRWGEWEGMTLAELRREHPDMQRNEHRGLDFTPLDGETPRQVAQRVQRWLQSIGPNQQNVIAVTHKGVIRATLSLATGWDMTNDPPYKLRWNCAHLFDVDGDGKISVREINVPLTSG